MVTVALLFVAVWCASACAGTRMLASITHSMVIRKFMISFLKFEATVPERCAHAHRRSVTENS